MKYPEVFEFKTIADPRGNLNFLEELINIPFEVKRVYWLTQIPEEQHRGDHAHKTGEQVIVCFHGVVQVLLENLEGDVLNFNLDAPNKGLYIPAMWWGRMVFRGNAILVGLASDHFSEADYIRDKKDFK